MTAYDGAVSYDAPIPYDGTVVAVDTGGIGPKRKKKRKENIETAPLGDLARNKMDDILAAVFAICED